MRDIPPTLYTHTIVLIKYIHLQPQWNAEKQSEESVNSALALFFRSTSARVAKLVDAPP